MQCALQQRHVTAAMLMHNCNLPGGERVLDITNVLSKDRPVVDGEGNHVRGVSDVPYARAAAKTHTPAQSAWSLRPGRAHVIDPYTRCDEYKEGGGGQRRHSKL